MVLSIKPNVMKNSAKTLSLVIAAAVSGVALFEIANASFSAVIRGDVVVAVATSLAFLGFAASDYSRRVQSLKAPARISRPALHTQFAEVCCLESDCNHRAAA
jgi:hypothetical protein